LPTPVTSSPAATVSAVSVVTVSRPDAWASWSTATSSPGSVPTTEASYVVPVDTMTTLMSVESSMTWLLVRISPSLLSTMPVPAASDPSASSV
jgi:hypothetical protein